MSQRQQPLQRTKWAERHVEELLSLPLIAEFVFRSPQTNNGRQQREVVDFLVMHDYNSILISQKCQEDPSSRDVTKTAVWARKKTKEGASQLCGAMRTGVGKKIWCDHPRRGRVDFVDGLPAISQGIVIVEVFQPVELESEASDLPLDFHGVPISYFSVNDFLNLGIELRTMPELLEYLKARRSLPPSDLRVIGDEKSLFEAYLLTAGSLSGCTSRATARELVSLQQERLEQLRQSKSETDHFSSLLEHVADQLAGRSPDYAVGLSSAQIARFEPTSGRKKYLEMQSILANLRLTERGELGRAFLGVIERLNTESDGFTYMAAHLDSRPHDVFVFASSKKLARAIILERMETLMLGAMAFYGKRRCLTVIDRDGLGYEVGLRLMELPPTPEEQAIGSHLFGKLRVMDRRLDLISSSSKAR